MLAWYLSKVLRLNSGIIVIENGILWALYALLSQLFGGAMIVDFSYSIHLATKLKDYKELAALRFEDFKKELKNRLKNIR